MVTLILIVHFEHSINYVTFQLHVN